MAALEALQECVEFLATLQHTAARTTRSTTHAHTNINNLHTQSNAPQKQNTHQVQHGGGRRRRCAWRPSPGWPAFSNMVLLPTNRRVQWMFRKFSQELWKNVNIHVIFVFLRFKTHIFPVQMIMWPSWSRRKITSWRSVKPPIGWRR